ncbi:MAG: alpha/beta hydrolase [bacterium]|nr:alpha/beta hydrolase [bacterium]
MRPAWLPQDLFPPPSHFVDVLGCRVHYVDQGAGPTLLMLHGNPTYSFVYRHLIAGLADRFRCIALDYPGFGLSTARNGYGYTPGEHAAVVSAFVQSLDLSDVTLVVQDWGGPIGLGFAGRHPERIRALVIGNTWAWPLNGEPLFEIVGRVAGGPLGGFLARNFNVFVNLFLPLGIRRKRLSARELAAYRGPFPTRAAREPTHIFPRQALAARDYLARVRDDLPKLSSLPVLFVWGDRDGALNERKRHRFEELLPNHRTVILRGASHFIQEDAPDEIAAALRAWWAECVERERPAAARRTS